MTRLALAVALVTLAGGLHPRLAGAADPAAAKAALDRGEALLARRENEAAVKAFTEAIAAARDRRGDAYLKLGKFKEAVADFDAYLAAEPAAAPQHWRRGIALYYAGRYA